MLFQQLKLIKPTVLVLTLVTRETRTFLCLCWQCEILQQQLHKMLTGFVVFI